MGRLGSHASVEVDRPMRDDGEWWFDVEIDGFKTQVSWGTTRGFGIYLGESGFGERPNELYADADLAVRRLVQLADEAGRGTAPAPMEVRQVRQLLGQTQQEVARTLRVGQANVSRLEGRSNPTLGSIRALVQAMGGELEVRAKFAELDVPIALPTSLSEFEGR